LILNKLAIIFGTSNQIKDLKLSVGPLVLKLLKSANFLSTKILKQMYFFKHCKLPKAYQSLPKFTKVNQCLPMLTNVYQCLPMFTNVYQCLPKFTNVYQCLSMLCLYLPIISKQQQHIGLVLIISND
jgi:hypothetical protein